MKSFEQKTVSVDYRMHSDTNLSIERQELFEKINRLEYYQAKINKRMQEIENHLSRVYLPNMDSKEIIDAGLKAMSLKSNKESIS